MLQKSYEPSPIAANLLAAKIDAKQALIGVIGLGYVGLPLSLAFAEAGVTVLGFDIDPEKAAAINNGRSYLKQFGRERVAGAVRTKRFTATSDMSRLSEPDVILICVPTPLTRHLTPDLSFVERTAESITAALRKGQLVVLESTTYPGTTSEVLRPILEQNGLVCGQDFWLAFSPEREDPGNERFTTTTIPKVVGADDEWSLRLASAVYGLFASTIVPVSSSATAEAVKITENVFRAVNIALANELKQICSAMNINVWEVIDAAKTKPFGFMAFYPGPGLGGHCIPIDPFYLAWKAREYGISTRFIELAGQINTAMPQHVVDDLQRALDSRFNRGLNNSRVLIIGVAYKKNVGDMRESPSLKLIELLEDRGAAVDFHDPHVRVIPPTREHASLQGRQSMPLAADALRGYDAVLIATDHDAVDYHLIVEASRLVVDTRNACARAGTKLDNVVLA